MFTRERHDVENVLSWSFLLFDPSIKSCGGERQGDDNINIPVCVLILTSDWRQKMVHGASALIIKVTFSSSD